MFRGWVNAQGCRSLWSNDSFLWRREEPMGDHLVPEHRGIDALLVASRRALAGRIAAGLDLEAGLAAIFSGFPESSHVTSSPASARARFLRPGEGPSGVGGRVDGLD
jgi:hypothetical protein